MPYSLVFWSSLLLHYYTLLAACGILPYFKYFRDQYCGFRQILAVFRPVGTACAGTASTSSTRSSTKIHSISAVYWKYEAYSDHLSVHRRFAHCIRILLQTAFIVDAWSHEWVLKQITFGGGNSSICSTGSISSGCYCEYWYWEYWCCEYCEYSEYQ